MMTPKDMWLMDCIKNFLCDNDLQDPIITKLKNVGDENKMAYEITKMSNTQKDKIISMHEQNLKLAMA